MLEEHSAGLRYLFHTETHKKFKSLRKKKYFVPFSTGARIIDLSILLFVSDLRGGGYEKEREENSRHVPHL